MEFDEINTTEGQEEDVVEIYSRRAIFWFFVLAGPLFGGVLLMLNLKAAGLKKAIYPVLAFTLLFDLASYLVLVNFVRYYNIDLVAYQQKLLNYKTNPNVFDEKIFILSVVIIILKVLGALVLTRYFFKKYFPDDDYYPKSVANALLFTVVALLLLQFIGLGAI